MTAHPRHALPIGRLIYGYQIVRMIGQGEFGIVYEASNPVTGERVAIKEFYPSAIATRQEGTIVLNNEREADLYQTVLDRFQQTAGTQFQFKHPNILRVFNYVPAENTGYMITEYIDGKSLRDFLQKYGGHFPTAEMFQITMEQVLGAIGYVHRQGHIHRDIAPDNVMIDRFEKPTVIDFGALKRDLRGSNAYSSIVMLREDYAPPEQQDPSLKQGFYTDLFALAGTMYCALSGAPPVRATTRSFTQTGDPYVPIEQASRIPCPPEVFNAIDSALRLPPRDRPQSMEEFVSQLQWTPNFGDETDAPRSRQSTYSDNRTTIEQPGRTSAPRPATGLGTDRTTAAPARPQPPLPPPQPEPQSPFPPPVSTPATVRRPSRSPWLAYVGIVGLIVVVVGGLYAASLRIDRRTDVPTPPQPPPEPPGKIIIADGQYRAVLGFPNPRGARCLARSDVPAVQVRKGMISFEAEDLSWRGTIDQRTGQISIPNQGITPIKIGALAKHGISITGNYKSAILHSGLCGTGFFRIQP